MSNTRTKYCKRIMQLLIQYCYYHFCLNDFLHFSIPWMIDVLFSCSFLHYGQTPKKVLQPLSWWISSEVMYSSHWVDEFHPRSCIYYWVKTSNVFYLRLLWRKSLFQVVTKSANSYRVLIKSVAFTDSYQ